MTSDRAASSSQMDKGHRIHAGRPGAKPFTRPNAPAKEIQREGKTARDRLKGKARPDRD